MKIVYKLDRQVENNVNYIIAIDESMFAHIANQQIWIIGLISINTKKWRLEIVTDKSLNTLKLIIQYILIHGGDILFQVILILDINITPLIIQ